MFIKYLECNQLKKFDRLQFSGEITFYHLKLYS